jgi:hypothetical protein
VLQQCQGQVFGERGIGCGGGECIRGAAGFGRTSVTGFRSRASRVWIVET